MLLEGGVARLDQWWSGVVHFRYEGLVLLIENLAFCIEAQCYTYGNFHSEILHCTALLEPTLHVCAPVLHVEKKGQKAIKTPTNFKFSLSYGHTSKWSSHGWFVIPFLNIISLVYA